MDCIRCDGSGKIEFHGLEKECTLCKGHKDVSLDYMFQWIVGEVELGVHSAEDAIKEIIWLMGKVGTLVDKPKVTQDWYQWDIDMLVVRYKELTSDIVKYRRHIEFWDDERIAIWNEIKRRMKDGE